MEYTFFQPQWHIILPRGTVNVQAYGDTLHFLDVYCLKASACRRNAFYCYKASISHRYHLIDWDKITWILYNSTRVIEWDITRSVKWHNTRVEWHNTRVEWHNTGVEWDNTRVEWDNTRVNKWNAKRAVVWDALLLPYAGDKLLWPYTRYQLL